MNSTVLAAAAAAGGIGGRPPFTAAQWQELEHQALIYKYLMAGVPVPPELLIPIQRSFEALPGRYYHPALGRSLSSVGYCSYYGKKLDPEPGRCRRTDGKKWRCSKDAHPDSKYCERHMHRGRNRSRKPVESESNSQLQSSSTATSPTPTASSAKASGGGGFQTVQHSVAVHSNKQTLCLGASSSLHLPMDQGPWGNRYFSGVKPGVDGHTFFPEVSGTARGLGMDSMDSPWHLMPSRVSPSSFPSLKAVNPALQNTYPQLSSVQELRQVTTSSISRQQQLQHSFSGGEFDPQESTKHEGQFLRAFFDDWPKPRDSWSDLEEETSNRSLYSTTQLSMSFPMASPDFSATSSRSPNSESVTTAALTPEI